MQTILVPMPDGDERMWIYAASPEGDGPYPVVVFAHGQGPGNIVNCSPHGVPDDVDVASSQRIADSLAEAGYVAVSVYYRNRGDTAPGVGTLRPRDHFVADARGVLAAAHWASETHGRGSQRVALLGASMGSFVVTWAVAPLPELADLQTGLDIRTVIPNAMLGNHIANTGRNAYLLDATDPPTRVAAIALAAFASVSYRAAFAGAGTITEASLDDPAIGGGLTPLGRELFADAFLRAPQAVAGCDGLADQPPVCAGACASATFASTFARLGIGTVDAADWLAPETLEAIRYWNPPVAVDPGMGTGNALLAAQRAMSPAYALNGPLASPRLLPLVSVGDTAVTAQLQGGNNAADIYVARLRATGVWVPDPVPVVTDMTCGHGDYHDPGRPTCGWAIVAAELSASFD